MNPNDLTNLADAVGATCHTHSMGRATSIMFSIQQLEQFAERLVAEEREKRIAAQTEAASLTTVVLLGTGSVDAIDGLDQVFRNTGTVVDNLQF